MGRFFGGLFKLLGWAAGMAVALLIGAEEDVSVFVQILLWGLPVLALLFLPLKPLRFLRRQRAVRVLGALLAGVCVISLFAGGYALYHAQYPAVDTGFDKSALGRAQNVLVIVPHEDDETLLAAPAIEWHVLSGAQVHVLMTTNGDSQGQQEARMQETRQALECMGLRAQDITFLGYSDDGDGEGLHLYNRADEEVYTSVQGRTQTYGSGRFTDYRTAISGAPSPYTRAAYLRDIKDVISARRPEVIYCIDYDTHVDHRALTLLTQEALGELMAEDATYRPRVLMGFAYGTIWYGYDDFYDAFPLAATAYISGNWSAAGDTDAPPYRWAERMRMPMPQAYRTYTLRANRYAQLFAFYKMQPFAATRTVAAANSDQVYFERRTDSLTYGARVEASSGDASVLTDFKLFDCADIREEECGFTAGLWSPTDEEKRVRVTFPAPGTIGQIRVCDAPDPDVNVLSLEATLSDGTVLTFTDIDPTGAVSTLAFPARANIAYVDIRFLETQGEGAGLTEIECAPPDARETEFISVLSENGDTAYWLPCKPEEAQQLSIYTYPAFEGDFSQALSVEGIEGARITPQGVLELPPLRAGTYTLCVRLRADAAVYTQVRVQVSSVMPAGEGLFILEQRLNEAIERVGEIPEYISYTFWPNAEEGYEEE